MSLVPHESAIGHVTGAALYSDDPCSHARLLRLSAACRKAMARNFVAKFHHERAESRA